MLFLSSFVFECCHSSKEKVKKIEASAVMRPILLKTMISVISFFLVIRLILVLVLWKPAI